jgi:nucleotide-binding universal stress UspA family protein
MKQSSAQVAAVPSHLIADTHGARYATIGDDRVELVEPMGRHGRIVVGVDGSEASVTALRRGIRMANALNASVEAITSWRFMTAYGAASEFGYTPEEDAVSILSGAVKSAFGSKIPQWFTGKTIEGNADQVLIDQSRGAEMLVVGSRGHGGLAGVLLGSVSAECAEHAHCPVLIIH